MLFQRSALRYSSTDPAELRTQNRKNQHKVRGAGEKDDRITAYGSFITLLSTCPSSSFIYSKITMELFKALALICQTKCIYIYIISVWSLFRHLLNSERVLFNYILIKL